MDEKELNDFKKTIKKHLQNRPQTYFESDAVLFNSILSTLFLLTSGVGLGYIISSLIKSDFYIASKIITPSLALLFAYFLVSARIKKGPKKRSEQNLWRWRHGRKIRILTLLTVFFMYLSPLTIGEHNQIAYTMLIVSIFSYLVFNAVIIVMIYNPRYFISPILVGIGSGAFFLGMPLFILSTIIGEFFTDNPSISFVILSFIGLLLLIIFPVKNLFSKELQPVQIPVIRMIEPTRLLNALKTHSEIINTQVNALDILKKTDYDTQIALLETLAKLHTPSTHKIWAILGFIFTFILGAIGEVFFQDLLYYPFIKPFLCTTNNLFCN